MLMMITVSVLLYLSQLATLTVVKNIMKFVKSRLVDYVNTKPVLCILFQNTHSYLLSTCPGSLPHRTKLKNVSSVNHKHKKKYFVITA